MESGLNYEGSEKWERGIERAKYHLKIADHMIYITSALIKDNRILIKILSEISESVSVLVGLLLQKEFLLKRVRISDNPDINLQTFIEKIAPRYLEERDIDNIDKIIKLKKKHVEAHVEFVRKDKFVILLGDKYETITKERVKEFMSSARKLMLRVI